MLGELNRYFIELQTAEGESVSRNRETELRRELAAQFLETVGQWLRAHELADKVSAMAVTALGQVQITCEPDIINHIRGQEDLNIAAIRQGGILTDTMGRWSEAR